MIYSFLLFFLFSIDNPKTKILSQNSSITLTVTNGQPNKGNVFIALYQNEKGFPGNVKYSYKSVKGIISENGISVVSITEVPKGEYAISVFQDENNDGILNTSVIGIPKESYGFSNDAHNPFGPPKFNDCIFTHKGDTKISIKLKKW